jgi:hypothetical protein
LVYRCASVISNIARAALEKQNLPRRRREQLKAGITRELAERRAKKTLPLINRSWAEGPALCEPCFTSIKITLIP